MKPTFSLACALLGLGLFSSAPQQTQAAPPAAAATGGIVLSRDWAGGVTMGSGGQTAKLDDLRFLLTNYGTADADVAPHPDVTVYDGPPMDPSLGESCHIPYLMPLDQAEKALLKGTGMASHGKAVAPGLPDGLLVHSYDVKFGHYNRLTILTDNAKPQPQVVGLQLKNERENWHPLHWKEIVRDWHTYDYINARNRGQPKIQINTRVDDKRAKGHYVVVNISFGGSPSTGSSWVQIAYRPSETTTWYIPEPMIKLILFTLSKQIGR